MSLRRVIIVSGLAGTVVALAFFGLYHATEALRHRFPITYVEHYRAFIDMMLMFWPSGFVFFWATTDMHTPVLSFTYVGFLLFSILVNAVTYSVVAGVSRRCLEGPIAGMVIVAASVLAYWIMVITMLPWSS